MNKWVKTFCWFLAIYLVCLYYAYLPSLAHYYGRKHDGFPMGHVIEHLCEAPVLGQLFMEEALFVQAGEGKWDRVRAIAEVAAQHPLHNGKFSVWYHKALAECFLQHYSEC